MQSQIAGIIKTNQQMALEESKQWSPKGPQVSPLNLLDLANLTPNDLEEANIQTSQRHSLNRAASPLAIFKFNHMQLSNSKEKMKSLPHSPVNRSISNIYNDSTVKKFPIQPVHKAHDQIRPPLWVSGHRGELPIQNPSQNNDSISELDKKDLSQVSFTIAVPKKINNISNSNSDQGS